MTPARPSRVRVAFLAVSLCAVCAADAQYIRDEVPEQARGLTLDDRLGVPVPMDIELIDPSGQTVALAESFDGGKPVLLVMAYYDCPLLCPAMLNQLQRAFNELDYALGEDFNLVVVSFDPTNTPAEALRAREQMLVGYDHSVPQDVVRAGLGFYVAQEDESRRLADAIGFDFRYLPDSDEYAHAMGLYVLTPQGALSRVFPNYTFRNPDLANPVRDLKLAMLDATQGRIAASIADVILHFCYRYDPNAGAYTVAAFRLMRVVAVLTAVGLAGLIVLLRVREVRKHARKQSREPIRTEPPPAAQPAVR